MPESSGCHITFFSSYNVLCPNYHKGPNHTYLPQYHNVQINFTASLYQSDCFIK